MSDERVHRKIIKDDLGYLAKFKCPFRIYEIELATELQQGTIIESLVSSQNVSIYNYIRDSLAMCLRRTFVTRIAITAITSAFVFLI